MLFKRSYFFSVIIIDLGIDIIGFVTNHIWVLSQENLSLGFPTRSYPNQPAQLQRLAIKLKFRKFRYDTFQRENNKGTDRTEWIHRLVCACVVRKPRRKGFLAHMLAAKVQMGLPSLARAFTAPINTKYGKIKI